MLKKFKFQPLFLLYSAVVGWLLVDLMLIIHGDFSDTNYFGIYGKEHFDGVNLLLYLGFVVICYCIFDLIFGRNESLKESLREPFYLVLSLSACFRIWYYGNLAGYTIYYDTDSYGLNYTGDLLAGKVDIFRTPIYPYFLKFTKLFYPYDSVGWYQLTAYLQMAISFASVALLYFALKKVISNKYIVSLTTLLYGCSPFLIQWDTCILTESLTISFFVAFIYLMISYLKKPTILGAVSTGVGAFLMVMLRPTFIYLFAILGAFWVVKIIFSKYDRKKTLVGLASLVLALSLTGGYCVMNEKSNNFLGISSVGTTVNNFYIVVDNNWYRNNDYKEISQFVFDQKFNENIDNIHIITLNTADKFGRKAMAEYVKSCLKQNREAYIHYTIEKYKSLMPTYLAVRYSSLRDDISFNWLNEALNHLTCPLSIITCFAVVGLGLLLCLAVVIKKKRIMWIMLGLCALTFTHIFVSIYGSMAEYQRLSMPAVIPVFIILACFVDLLASGISKTIDNTSDEIKIK